MLTPDFLRKEGALEIVMAARPDVFNHNLETVPSLYREIRPGARYDHSLRLLERAKELDEADVHQVGHHGRPRRDHGRSRLPLMDDLRAAQVDFLTIGQYLQPTRKHAAIDRFVPPEEFDALRAAGEAKGFLLVAASPLTRSSYHAADDFARLKAARHAALGR